MCTLKKRRLLEPSLNLSGKSNICLLCALINLKCGTCLTPFVCLILERQDWLSPLKPKHIGLNSKP
jgi:hypothetical protein